VLAITGALALPSAIAALVLGRTVLHAVGLSAGAVETIAVACPRGYLAMSGGVSVAAPGVALLRAVPAGTRAYAFALGNPAPNPARRVTVAVGCRALRARTGAKIRVRHVAPRSFRVAPGAQRTAALACPAGTAPAGAGVDLAPGGRRSSGFGGTPLSLRKLTESLRGFSFTVRNAGRSARTVAISGTCITVVSRAGSSPARLRVKVTTYREPLDSGRRTLTRRCPRGWFSLAAGYALPAPALTMEAAAAITAGARWSVFNSSNASRQVVLQLACGRVT
jgi:hypothetical protein